MDVGVGIGVGLLARIMLHYYVLPPYGPWYCTMRKCAMRMYVCMVLYVSYIFSTRKVEGLFANSDTFVHTYLTL